MNVNKVAALLRKIDLIGNSKHLHVWQKGPLLAQVRKEIDEETGQQPLPTVEEASEGLRPPKGPPR